MEKFKKSNEIYNRNLRESHDLSKKAEEFYTKPEDEQELSRRVGVIKDIPENINTPKVLVKLGNPNTPDKFVHMKDEEGREYIIALPIQNRAYHRDIANFCRKLYKKEFTVIGGGYTHVKDETLIIHGTSEGFGEADKDHVKKLLEEAFPDIEIKSVSQAEGIADDKKKRAEDDYKNAFEKIANNIGKDLYADVIHDKAVRMGYDMTMIPRTVEGSDNEMAYMVYCSENGSSFGIDTLYIGYKDKDGTMKSKELAITRWRINVNKAELVEGILTIEITTEDSKKITIKAAIDDLDNIESISNLDERDRIILEMYRNHQDIYRHNLDSSTIYHGLVY